MNLHRTGKVPQWELTEAPENIFQVIAAKTHGILTPANLASLTGAALVGSGLYDVANKKPGRGIFKIGVGRLFDLLDGQIAEATKTKSPLGEGLDVVIDKAEAAAALPILAKADILPKPAASVIAGQSVSNAVISAVARRRSIELHPSQEGKLTVLGQWSTIGLYGLAAAARSNDHDGLGRGLEVAGHISAIATAVLGAAAVSGYAREALQSTPAVPTVVAASAM